MRARDTCPCGAWFEARGRAVDVGKVYAVWLTAHGGCRGDERVYEVDEDGRSGGGQQPAHRRPPVTKSAGKPPSPWNRPRPDVDRPNPSRPL